MDEETLTYPDSRPLARSVLAELLGSSMLAMVVVGSGIAAQTLSPNAVGLELLENALATAAGLYALILMFAPVSGAHFNPVITLVDAWFGGVSRTRAMYYVLAQVVGCASGAVLSNLMFSRPAISISTKVRASPAHALSELIATAGLLLLIFGLARTKRSAATPAAVGAYIGAAYFFTSSASFANPAIALGRTLSNTFAGIAPASVPLFIGAELVGGVVGFFLIKVLYPAESLDTTSERATSQHRKTPRP